MAGPFLAVCTEKFHCRSSLRFFPPVISDPRIPAAPKTSALAARRFGCHSVYNRRGEVLGEMKGSYARFEGSNRGGGSDGGDSGRCRLLLILVCARSGDDASSAGLLFSDLFFCGWPATRLGEAELLLSLFFGADTSLGLSSLPPRQRPPPQ